MINVVLEIWLTKLDIRDLYFFILLIPHVIIVDISFTEEIGGWLCSYFDGVLDGI